jgi:hypothetical protein
MNTAALRSCRYRRTALVAALTVLLLAAPAGAALIAQDLFAPGDELITLDTDTNLKWLDLTATLNLSYDDIIAGAGGFIAAGFGYATTPQVETLWTNAGVVDTSGAMIVGNRAAVDLLLGLMGCTSSCGSGNDVAQGQAEFNPAQVELNGPFLQLGGGGLARADIDPGFTQTRDFASPTLGNYLVRPAPEPSTGLLVGGGLLALGFSRRRSRRF